MVIDSSVLIAILEDEPERDGFLDAMARSEIRLMSTASVVEASNIALSRTGEQGLAILEQLIEDLRIDRIPVAVDHIRFAVDAFRRFGKGRHPAGLNFGDCFPYALARATGAPLLFKGDDFTRTDIKPAL